MDKHRIIVGWLFASVAMFLAVFIAFTWKKAFGVDADVMAQQTLEYAIAVAALFCGAGLTLLLNYRHSAWFCLPLSAASLIYFPFGTVLGGYYIWYFWKFIYKRDNQK